MLQKQVGSKTTELTRYVKITWRGKSLLITDFKKRCVLLSKLVSKLILFERCYIVLVRLKNGEISQRNTKSAMNIRR